MYMYMFTGQIWSQVKFFALILNFLCVLALIIDELGLEDKGNWEST